MLAELAGRAALILALSWIGARLAFRRSASTRYAVWAAGFIAALALPVATGVLPSWPLAVLPPQDAPATALSRPLDTITRTAASSAASTPPTSLAPTEATDQKETAAVARPAHAPSTVPSTPTAVGAHHLGGNRRGPRRAVCGQLAGGALDHAAGSTHHQSPLARCARRRLRGAGPRSDAQAHGIDASLGSVHVRPDAPGVDRPCVGARLG